MIERRPQWYHYIMPSFLFQLGAVMVALVIITAQLVYYAVIDYDTVVFEGPCEVTIGPTNADGDVTRRGAIMMCGDDTRHLGALETPYLYEVLTNNREPVIFCVKTVSEYLNNTSWSCEMDPEERDEV